MLVNNRSNKKVKKTSPLTDSRSAWFTLAILSSTLLAVMFSETMLLPAIPEIMHGFKVPYSTSAWIFSAYLIVAAVMTPIAGKLSDIYGKKKVLLTLLVIYIAGIIAGGFANSISFLLVSRVIQGVGLAAVPAAFSLLRDTFPPQKLAIAVGVFGSAYSGGSVVGLLVGASIIQNFGWHATFFSIAPVAVIVAAMIAKFVKDSGKNAQLQLLPIKGTGDVKKRLDIDLKGALALSSTISSFLIALTLIETGLSSENVGKIAFHSTEFQVATNLAMIATGLSLTSTAVWNLLVTSSPKEFTGISVGVGAMLFFVGMAIGPALAGLLMQSNVSVEHVGPYPAPESYNMIFLTAGLFAIASLMLSVILRKRRSTQTTGDVIAA